MQKAKDEQADLIIHGGDLFFRSKIPTAIIDRVYEMLYRYADNEIPIIIVPGNHERSVLPQSIFLNHPYIYVFQQAESFVFDVCSEKVVISGFPNIRNGIREKFALLQSRILPHEEALNILMMHQSVDGCRVEKHIFYGDADTVDINDINKHYDLVLCGHIHRRQILVNGRQPIIYAGSVERTSSQEMNEPKGFYEIIMRKQKKDWKPEKIVFHQSGYN